MTHKTTTISPEAWKLAKHLQLRHELPSMVEVMDKIFEKAFGSKWKENLDQRLMEMHSGKEGG